MSAYLSTGIASSDNLATADVPGHPTTRPIESSSTARVALARARQVLVDDPGALFGHPRDHARCHRRHRTALRVSLGGGASLHQEVEVQTRPPRPTDTGVAWPVRWEPTGRRRFVPSFEGELELTAVRKGASLRLAGAYTVPLGRIGWIGDRLIGGRLAQRSLDEFVARLRRRIEAEVQRRFAAPMPSIVGGPGDAGCERPEIYIG